MTATSIKNRADAAFKTRERIKRLEGAAAATQAAHAAEESKIARLRLLRLSRDAEESPALVKRNAPRA
jgi:hypothetical protein